MPTETPDAQEPQEITEVEVVEASIEPGGLGEIEVDITENLSEDQVRDLFAAFNDEDWAEVDRLTEEFEKTGVYTDNKVHESKAGGADRNRGSAEQLRHYWTVGVGGQKIRWGTPGDFRRCVALVSKHLGPRAKGYCALRHKEQNGYWPGDRRNKSFTGPDAVAVLRTSLPVSDSPANDATTGTGEDSTGSVKVVPIATDKASGITSLDVLGAGHLLQVTGVDATDDPTQVVYLKSLGDGSFQVLFQGDSVSQSTPVLPVPVREGATNPQQAGTKVGAVNGDRTRSGVRTEGEVDSGGDYSGPVSHEVSVVALAHTASQSAGTMVPVMVIDLTLADSSAHVPTLTKSDSPDLEVSDPAYHEGKEDVEPMIEHKVVSLKGMNVVDAEKGIVETIISVTGIVDNVKDRILPGAYSKTLAKRKPKGVWCVDADTEALTADGWKSYTDLQVGDLVYTLGEDGLARFQPVQAVNVFPAEQRRMRKITTSVHSSLTTENHRWLVQTRDGGMRWRTSETLVPEDKIVRAAPGADLPDEPKYNDAFVQVVAWFWTEGHIDGERLSISQSSTVNPDKCRRIEGALTHVFHGAWNVQTKTNGQSEYRLNHAPSAAVLSVVGEDKAPTTDFLRSLTPAQLSMFIATCIDGDGHRQDNGAEFFYQRSAHSIGIFQMACALAGVATNTVLREFDDTHYGRPVHRVTLSKRATTMPLKAISEQQRTGGGERVTSTDEWVDHDGVVWCPTTPAGTWLARRDGTIWFTGNSHDWDTPVSKTLDVKELLPGDPELPKTMPDGDPWPSSAGALKVKTQFNLDTQRGREAYSDVVFFADEQEWSIGYNVPVGGAKVDQKSGIREIETLELYEYSPVLFGAMPLARTTSVKEAQLAMKALRGGAASWLSEAVTEEVTPAGPDAEEKDVAAELDEYELPGDQMVLVKRAISTLTDLLSVVQGTEFKADDAEDEEEAAEAPEEDSPAEEAEEEVTEYDSLSSAVSDMVEDPDLKTALVDAAKPVDSAIESDDAEGMDAATSKFLDVVESALGEGKSSETLKEIALMLADLIENVVGDGGEEMPNEDNIEKKEPEEKSDTISTTAVQDGNVVLNTDEITSLLDSLK